MSSEGLERGRDELPVEDAIVETTGRTSTVTSGGRAELTRFEDDHAAAVAETTAT